MATHRSLSSAKARLSEVVCVDGEPAVRVLPIGGGPRELTDAEVASVRVLLASLRRIERPDGPFDAVDLVREGRRLIRG